MAMNTKPISAKPLNEESSADKRSESSTLMKMERPMPMNKSGFFNGKGAGPTLDKQTRPFRSHKILY